MRRSVWISLVVVVLLIAGGLIILLSRRQTPAALRGWAESVSFEESTPLNPREGGKATASESVVTHATPPVTGTAPEVSPAASGAAKDATGRGKEGTLGASAAPKTPVFAPVASDPLEPALALLRAEKLMEARAALTRLLLETPTDGDLRRRIRAHLDELNSRMFFSPMPTPDSIMYRVEPGDSLWKIARAYKSSPELIMLVNRKSREVIRPGERLKIPQGEFSVLVEKAHLRLTVFLNGHYIKEYLVGLGREGRTPTGEFVVDKMVKDPEWTSPEGKVYKPGDPNNILGTRWIGFKETPEHSGYGIHGTTDEESIGALSSNGCVRLRNKDVEELFGMLQPGAKVVIR